MKAKASNNPTGRQGVPTGSINTGLPTTRYAVISIMHIVPHKEREPRGFPLANYLQDWAYIPRAKYPMRSISLVGWNCRNMPNVNQLVSGKNSKLMKYIIEISVLDSSNVMVMELFENAPGTLGSVIVFLNRFIIAQINANAMKKVNSNEINQYTVWFVCVGGRELSPVSKFPRYHNQ